MTASFLIQIQLMTRLTSISCWTCT